jgi:catechol 2,3-dioxygenase-like lactoylglutathione lyase family enzyme
MALTKLGHVVLKVRDLDRSEAFYTDVLGLAVTGRLPGQMVHEKPRETWPAGRNPFAGREPLPFRTAGR